MKIKGRLLFIILAFSIFSATSVLAQECDYLLDVGDNVIVDGKLITLVNVGEGGGIVVDVHGVLDTILSQETKTINGVQITNSETYYTQEKSERSARILVVGEECGQINQGNVCDFFMNVGDFGIVDIYSISLVNVGEGGGMVVNVNGLLDTINPSSSKNVNGVIISNIETYYTSEKSERSARLFALGNQCSEVNNEPSCKFFMNVDDQVTVDGKSILLENVGEGKAIVVKVDGTFGTIHPAVSTKTINGAEITNLDSFYTQEKSERSANVVVKGNQCKEGGNFCEYFLNVGESVIVDNHEIRLINVGEGGAIVVEVDGVLDTISASSNKIVNGVNIRNIATYYTNEKSERSADIGVEGDVCGSVGETRCVINGICETEFGENEFNCPQDCKEIPPSGPLDLSFYPKLFVKNGDFVRNFALVIGQTAPASDTLAAVDVAQSLQNFIGNPEVDIETRLDVEIVDPLKYNLILFSTGNHNRLIGNFKIRDFKQGSLQLSNNGNNIALLVLGKEAIDTRMASRVLAKWDEYTLKGTAVCVDGSFTKPKIVPCLGGDLGQIPSLEEVPEYIEEGKPVFGYTPTIGGKCDSGCLFGDTCIPIGTRASGEYCSIFGRQMEPQKETGSCENNFECKSNSCLDSQCTETGFWTKLFGLLSKIFGKTGEIIFGRS